jgi:hypothetical protein
MASNWTIFEKQLFLMLKNKSAKSPSDFAERFATILDSTVRFQSSTVFGNVVISSNKELVKNGIEFALKLAFQIEKYKAELSNTLSELEQQEFDLDALKESLRVVKIPGFSNYLNQYLDKIKSEPAQDQVQNIKSFVKKVQIEDLLWFFAASQISTYYLTAQFLQVPPAPPSVAPTLGVTVTSPGNIVLLASSLKIAFKSKKEEDVALKCRAALELYTKTVSGIYSGTTAVGIPAITPWIGIF